MSIKTPLPSIISTTGIGRHIESVFCIAKSGNKLKSQVRIVIHPCYGTGIKRIGKPAITAGSIVYVCLNPYRF